MSQTMDPGEQQFFEQGEQALEEELDEPRVVPEAPHDPVRRARLRRIVFAAVLASVALCAAGLLARYSAARARARLDAQIPYRRVMFDALLPSVVVKSEPSAPSLAALPTPTPSVGAPSASGDPSQLVRAARALLEAGHVREGVAAARLAVDANPGDAEPYVLLAAGLQDQGRWAEAQSVFSACKQKTSSGPHATCRYFAAQ